MCYYLAPLPSPHPLAPRFVLLPSSHARAHQSCPLTHWCRPSCPPSISPQLSPLRALTLLLAPSPVWRSGGACSGVGRAMGYWRTWGCQCGGACSLTARLTSMQGWGAQSRGWGGQCWVQWGRVTASGAREAALVGRRIVAWPVRWRPSRGGSVVQWGCRTWRTHWHCAP